MLHCAHIFFWPCRNGCAMSSCFVERSRKRKEGTRRTLHYFGKELWPRTKLLLIAVHIWWWRNLNKGLSCCWARLWSSPRVEFVWHVQNWANGMPHEEPIAGIDEKYSPTAKSFHSRPLRDMPCIRLGGWWSKSNAITTCKCKKLHFSCKASTTGMA